MKFIYKSFSELNTIELYHLIELRTNVFVVEQDCPYPELDNKDQKAIHVWAKDNEVVVAVARILPPGISYPNDWSFGRIATHADYRGKSIGRALMQSMMEYMKSHHPNSSIRISAQAHLDEFYNSFGFEPTGKSYLEDGIPHIEMLFDGILTD
ncbi:MAG: GNAT family N-acetyltransferase [Crocinitomicaceae bacterium]